MRARVPARDLGGVTNSMSTKARLHIERQQLERAMAVLHRRPARSSQAEQGTISNLRGKDSRRGNSLLVLPGWGSKRAKDSAWDLGGVTYSKNTMVGLRIRRQLREHVHNLQRWRQLRRQAGRGATLGDIVTLEVASSARLSGSGYP
jgi:hypothetical protein